MFYKNDEVRTCNGVSKESKDILIKNGIKPGTRGIVIDSVEHLTVNFSGKIVSLRSDAVELDESFDGYKSAKNGATVETLMGMFGMKK